MRKLYRYILLILLTITFNISLVNAEGACSFTNRYYNTGEFTPGTRTNADGDALIYEITGVRMVEDTFEVYGWAFSSIHDCILNGNATGSGAEIWLYFYPIDSGDTDKSKRVELDIEYATEADANNEPKGSIAGRPKYFDYTFWNCYKTRINGENKCYSSNDGSGNVHGLASPILKGGFKASIDLKKAYEDGVLEENTDYRLKILFHRAPVNGSDTVWRTRDASVFKGLVDSTVTDYGGFKNEDGNQINIEISGFGEKAEVLVRDGIPQGPSGLGCDSPFGNKTMYYTKGDQYVIGDQMGSSCRGKIGEACNTSGRGAGQINLYQLYLDNNARATSSKSQSAYAPSSWLVVDGTIDITTKTKDGEDPDVCEGDEIYYLYYYFADGVKKDFKGNINYSAAFNDAKVLEELEFESNTDMTKEGGPLSQKTTRANLETFYDNFWAAIDSGDNYIEQDGKYYLVPTDGFHQWPGGGAYTFTANKGYDKNSLVTHDQKAFNIGSASGGLGYQFTVNEAVDYSKGDIPLSIQNGTKATAIEDFYKHFTVYQLTVCRTEEPEPEQCEDVVEPTVCTEGDVGTHAVYHENPNIKDCTLQKGTHSGFTIVEREETVGDYGTVACKEDLDFYFPGGKETASGQYFVLDNYIPKIEANRTCATSTISYEKLENNLKSFEENMPKIYNDYRDNYRYWENRVKPATTYEISMEAIDTTCPDPNTGDPIAVHADAWSITAWKIESDFTGPNGTDFPAIDETKQKDSICSYECNGGSLEPVMCTGQLLSEKKEEVKNTVKSLKKSYEDKLKQVYEHTNGYNKLFNWTETTTNLRWIEGGELTPAASIETVSVSEDTRYTFKPNVTFNYQDPDGKVFPVPYTYPNDAQSPGENKDYWGEGSEPDNKYENGGSSLDPQDRPLINCIKGEDTCETSTTITGNYYHNAAVRRDEDMEYEYHLPRIVTTIPDGRVQLSRDNPDCEGGKIYNDGGSNKTGICLEPEAVPVNINTLAGIKYYSITVEHYKDKLRKDKFSNNEDDDWADNDEGEDYKLVDSRVVKNNVFNGKTFGDEYNEYDYVCTYDVINDVYLPGPQKFNFFYRVVDTLNINPLGRTLGYNWTDARAQEVQANIKEDALSVTNLYEAHEKFVFELDPVTMQSIRSYNAKQDKGYSDWSLVCSDYDQTGSRAGYHCYSNFLNCLVDSASGSGCSEIVGAYHDNGDYGITELNNNRALLISKQNALDGKGG